MSKKQSGARRRLRWPLVWLLQALAALALGALTSLSMWLGGFVHGAAAGATFTLIVFIAAVIAGGDSVLPSPYSYICRIGAALLSLLGAYLGGRRGKRRIGGAPRMPKIKR